MIPDLPAPQLSAEHEGPGEGTQPPARKCNACWASVSSLKLWGFAGLPVARKLFPDEIRALGDENMMEGTKPTFSGGFLPTCMF